MEFIPVLYLSPDFQIKGHQSAHLKDVMKKEGFTNLYVIDERGINKNEPQYDFYQRFSSLYDLWVDTGPRDIGDVVDDIFSGTKNIIIRGDLWTEESLSGIRELTGHSIYFAFDVKDIRNISYFQHLLNDADGVILFITKVSRLSFIDSSDINRLIEKKPVYIFDSMDNRRQWKDKQVKGFLQDINSFL